MPYWLEIFLAVTPWMAWFFAAGIPWALVILPRHDWRDRTTVLGLGLGLGPVLGTVWLFFLGTFGQFTFPVALLGTVLSAVAGAILAWQRRPHDSIQPLGDRGVYIPQLTAALIGMMALGIFANIWDTAFWPFLRYDTLWTFGYNAKIFALENRIPSSIDYYPQLVPLTYTFGVLAHGEYSDYAARAAVPWFILTSTFAAYLAGWRIFERRIVGLVTAALWLLLPSSLVWSSAGDLEHTVALYFTLATTFFVLAWRSAEAQPRDAIRYALIAGLMAGAALWTKPTAGAFVLGVGLTAVLATIYALVSGTFALLRRRLAMFLVMGMAAAPLGGLWYLRNILLGHAWTNLPARYWQDFAQRSGQQLGWIWLIALLAAVSLVAHLWQSQRQQRPALVAIVGGILLLSRGVLPTFWDYKRGFLPFDSFVPVSPVQMIALLSGGILVIVTVYRLRRARWVLELILIVTAILMMTVAIYPTSRSLPRGSWDWQTTWDWMIGIHLPMRPLSWREVVLFVGGGLILIGCGWRRWHEQSREVRDGVVLTWLVGLPFFVVWFVSFSYHYRLVLTILPIFFATIALLVSAGFLKLMARNRLRRWTVAACAVLLALPSPVAGAWHTWNHAFYPDEEVPLENDFQKYAYANPGLMQLVAALQEYTAFWGLAELRILAPGENRLAFFFPEWQINDHDIPAEVPDLASYDVVVLFNHGFSWGVFGKDFTQVTAWANVAWLYPLPEWHKEDARDGPYGTVFYRVLKPVVQLIGDEINRYEVFRINTAAAWQAVVPETQVSGVVFGDMFELIGYDLPSVENQAFMQALGYRFEWRVMKRDAPFDFKFYWRGADGAPPATDLSIYLHLVDANDKTHILHQSDGGFMNGQYATRFLYPGMVIQDRRYWRIPAEVQPGPAILRIGFYNAQTWERLPVTVDGEAVGDGFTMESRIIVR